MTAIPHSHDSPERRRANISALPSPRRSRVAGGLSPRAYQARVDASRLWDLKLQGRSSAEISRMMGKDPAWVCRTLKKIESDFSAVFHRPKEAEFVNDHLAKMDLVFSKALKVAEDTEGMAKVAALRTVNTILQNRMQFLQHVGMVSKNQESNDQFEGFSFG